MVQGIVPGGIGIRLPFIKGSGQEKAGEDEKHLYRYGRPRRDGEAIVKKGDDKAQYQLDGIQSVASAVLHNQNSCKISMIWVS